MTKILIVDDEEDILTSLTMRLKAQGYQVIQARDGRQAVESAARSNPDLILMDIKLPVLNGYEACRSIRAHPELSRTPVIFLTADASVRVSYEAEQFGFSDYLIKPFFAEALEVKMKSLLV